MFTQMFPVVLLVFTPFFLASEMLHFEDSPHGWTSFLNDFYETVQEMLGGGGSRKLEDP